jgi:hypothetical protein
VKRSVLGLSGLACLLLAAACSTAQDSVGASEAAHTEGELAWSNDPYHWVQVSQEEIDTAFAEKTVPQNHAIAVRLQDWITRFDTEVRAIVRAKTGQTLIAPSPKIRVVVDAAVNAFIMGLPTCLASVAKPEPGAYPLIVFTGPSKIAQGNDTFCVEPLEWPAATNTRLDWLNRLGGYPVRPEASALVIGDGVSTGTLRAGKVATIASASLVNVNLGLVANMSEKSAAVVIAHELGHYYRSHSSTASEPHYDFWFDRERQIPERPKPVADQAQYAAEYERLKVPRFLIAGQTAHPRVATTLINWMTSLQVAPGHVCEQTKKTIASWPAAVNAELTQQTLSDELSGAARRAYLDLEKVAAPCIAKVKLTDEALPPPPAPGTTQPTTTTPFPTENIPRQWFLQKIAQPLRASIQDAELASSTSLEDLVARLTTKSKALDAEAPAFLQRLADNQIGLYTGEQEADDISMEIATKLGITPSEVLNSYVELMRFMNTLYGDKFEALNNSFTSAECEALMQRGFREANGQSIHMPLGTLDDPHHALCYRIFNLYRENEAHAYRTGAPNFPNSGASWADIQAQAKAIINGGPIAPQTPNDPSKPDKPGKPGSPTGGDDDSTNGDDSTAGGETTGGDPTTGGTKSTTTTMKSGCSATPTSTATSSGTFTAIAVILASQARLFVRRRRRSGARSRFSGVFGPLP